MPKVLKLTCRLLWCLSACKKSFSSLTSFLTYCKDTTDLLFWELWKCLTIPIKIVVSISIMLTCMQKINFFIHYFLKILQRNSNGFILGNLGMHGHTHLKWQYHFEETFHNHQQAQINFIFYVFLEILQRYCKLVVLGTLDMPGYAHPKWYYQFVEKFCLSAGKNIKFMTHAFLEILQRYANLFWVLWACLVIHNQIDSINLWKTSMFICMPKK